MNRPDLTSTQLAILAMIRAKDKNGVDYAPIPGRIHLVKELFAIYTTDVGKKVLKDLRFEPDNFGPFDETIFAGLDELTDAGLVKTVAEKNVAKIELTPAGKRVIDNLWAKIRPEIKQVIEYVKHNYNHKSSETVLKDIYAAHPEMAVNSLSKVAIKYKPQERQPT